MKKKVLFYLLTAISTLSLQSCVTNYVVSKPNTYTTEYKSDANLSSLDRKKIESAKKQLLDNFGENDERLVAMEGIESSVKNAEIAKAIYHTQTIDGLLSEAETYLGTPYRYGGTTRNGIDCSAFVLSVFGAAVGINLPRVAAAQALEGENIDREHLQKGDLIFFSQGGGRISHVGIVYDVTSEGDIKFIHSSSSNGVSITSLNNSSYWSPKFRFAKRIIRDMVNLPSQFTINK